MKRAGIIGGIGPESTVDYYHLIIAAYRERTQDGTYPSLLINSIDLKKVIDLLSSNQLGDVITYLGSEIRRLASGGADFGLLAANTPHVVFDALSSASPIPLISIVEATCQAAQRQDLTRLGLLGTRFTMQGRFYPDVFLRARINLVVPTLSEQDFVHDKYMSELVPGIIRLETREAFLEIIRRLTTQEKIDGLILAGTELPLLLRDVESLGIPCLDTTKLHVEQVVARLLS